LRDTKLLLFYFIIRAIHVGIIDGTEL